MFCKTEFVFCSVVVRVWVIHVVNLSFSLYFFRSKKKWTINLFWRKKDLFQNKTKKKVKSKSNQQNRNKKEEKHIGIRFKYSLYLFDVHPIDHPKKEKKKTSIHFHQSVDLSPSSLFDLCVCPNIILIDRLISCFFFFFAACHWYLFIIIFCCWLGPTTSVDYHREEWCKRTHIERGRERENKWSLVPDAVVAVASLATRIFSSSSSSYPNQRKKNISRSKMMMAISSILNRKIICIWLV